MDGRILPKAGFMNSYGLGLLTPFLILKMFLFSTSSFRSPHVMSSARIILEIQWREKVVQLHTCGLERRLGWRRSRYKSERDGKQKILITDGTWCRCSGRQARNLVTILTELPGTTSFLSVYNLVIIYIICKLLSSVDQL
jgi:hypothetical protein